MWIKYEVNGKVKMSNTDEFSEINVWRTTDNYSIVAKMKGEKGTFRVLGKKDTEKEAHSVIEGLYDALEEEKSTFNIR